MNNPEQKSELNFTVAVMIYNVEQYLPACIKSIMVQSGDDIEILLIDDGSTDDSGNICDRYAEKDKRIRVIHKMNGGVSNARNTAVKQAKGKWLIMVDGDDLLTDTAIEMCRKYLNDDSDWIQFDAVTFADTLSLENWQPKGKEVIIENEKLNEFHTLLIDRSSESSNKYPVYNINPAWSKMWNMDFIRKNDLWYDSSVKKGEGTIFTFTASYIAKKVRIVPRVIYGYRINLDSIMHRFSPDIIKMQKEQWMHYYKIIESHHEEKNKFIMDSLKRRGIYLIENAIHLGIAHRNCNMSKKEKIEWAKELCELEWVQQTVAYASEQGLLDKEKRLIKKRNYIGLVRYCNCLRRRNIFAYRLHRNGIGKAVIAVYRNVRYSKHI